VKNSSDAAYDPSLLMCEDFEAPTLHDNVGFGNGAPYYGPWYDDTGDVGDRGYNSYWFQKYSNGSDAALWRRNQPASPTLGTPCTKFDLCVGMKVWHPQDIWTANDYRPNVTILRNGEFNAEIGSITSPTGAAGGGAGVFDGQQSFAHRIPAGLGEVGIEGNKSFGGARRTFGITMAMAFPSNLISSGIMDGDPIGGGQMWKFNEWHPTGSGAGGDGIFGFGHYGSMSSSFPFYGFMFYQAPGDAATQSACNASVASATKTVGSFGCTDSYASWNESSGAIPGSPYSRPVDWPLGTWGCIRGTYTNMGAANASVKITFTPSAGPRAGTEITVVDISNWNMGFTPGLASRTGGYDQFIWNAYYNGLFNNGLNQGISQTTFRYEDNIHIRAGAPVSCAQIGFGSSGAASPAPAAPAAPAAPGGVRLQ
jgi:hypothetical protein